MNFRPLGVVYRCENYAQTPTPLVLQDRVRVFVAARDSDGKSFVRFVDLDLDDPTKAIDESGKVLGRGKPGAFDQDGAMPSFAELSGQHGVHLWYSGWTACQTTPYHNATGMAVSHNGGRTFERRLKDGPILDRTESEPYLRVTPCSVDWRIWYVSGLRWEFIEGKFEPIYVIRHKTHNNENPIVIPQSHDLECFSRPWVVRKENYWQMFYSYRHARDYRDGPGAYRLGYAESSDGEAWHRHDGLFNLARTPGFDDTMQCYAALFTVKEKVFMVYNGAHFGKYGFALAVAQ